MSVRVEGATRVIDWRTEFDLRDGLAEWAEMAGWGVETEHVIPGWGRPDLYLTSGDYRMAVEVKTTLGTPSLCRKAIEQADRYVKALPEVSACYLVAAHVDRAAMRPYDAAYDLVTVATASEFLAVLDTWPPGINDRRREALARLRQAESELEKRRLALAGVRDVAIREDPQVLDDVIRDALEAASLQDETTTYDTLTRIAAKKINVDAWPDPPLDVVAPIGPESVKLWRHLTVEDFIAMAQHARRGKGSTTRSGHPDWLAQGVRPVIIRMRSSGAVHFGDVDWSMAAADPSP